MRIFEYVCDGCRSSLEVPLPDAPPIGSPHPCPCGAVARRVFSLPNIPPEGALRDPDFVPAEHRIASNGTTGVDPSKKERLYQKMMDEKRKAVADGGNRGNIRMTHSIPGDLYYGKIRQTGDKAYWDDPKNRNKHKSTQL